MLNVACPLDVVVTLTGTQGDPFTRRVTKLLICSLDALARTVDMGNPADPLVLTTIPASVRICASRSCCSALRGIRATLTVSVAWSRTLLPKPVERFQPVQLRQAAFDVADSWPLV